MKTLQSLGIIMIAVLAACCNEEQPVIQVDPTVRMTISHTFDGNAISINNVQYATNDNVIGFSTVSYYLSGFEFKKADGTWYSLPNRYELIRGEESLSDTIEFRELPKGAYTGVRFKLGIDSLNNHADPALWPNDHALSLMRGGLMHWSWNAGYIFLKLEGRYKRTDGRIDGLYSYHIGRDDLISSYTFENMNFNYNEETVDLKLKFQLEKFFDSPHAHVISDSSGFTHSSFGDEVAEILHGNMVDIFTMD